MSRTTTVDQPGPTVPADKPLRADARRNRDLLVEQAAALFEERGVDASLEEVARRAGVGIGTLYRHFPTRNALVAAVYRREVELLTGQVDALLAEHAADVALGEWMRAFAVYVARKRGMADALKAMISEHAELFAESRERITGALTRLVAAAVAEGSIRADVDPEDLLRAMSGICMAADPRTAGEQTGRITALLMDGLRFGVSG